jgi:hypothetical protein
MIDPSDPIGHSARISCPMPEGQPSDRGATPRWPWDCRRLLEMAGSRRLVDSALLLALVTAVLVATYAYVAAERTFYYWDHAVFQDITWRTTAAFRASPAAGLAEIQRSYHDDYNALFAVPLVPFQLLFGESRLAYELALALVYFCPFALALGLLATRLLIAPPRLVFWTAAWLTLLVPIAWVPGLRGYPDAGAAALVVLALTIQMRDLESQRLWPPVAVGALLGVAGLFRRHFVYAAVAFLATVLALGATRSLRRVLRREPSLPLLLRTLRGVAMMVAAMAGTVAVLGMGFAERLRDYDFHALYRGYEMTLADLLRWYQAPYGWVALIAAAVGLLLGSLNDASGEARTRFLATYAGISVVQWATAVRQVGEQYTLHFTPIVVLGLLLFGWAAGHQLGGAWRAALATLGACYLAVNLFLGLVDLDPGRDAALRPLFAGKWDMSYRWDDGEVRRLIEGLRAQAPDPRVYVAASSDLINPDLLRHAEWQLFGRRHATLDVLAVPEVDSRDYYPLGRLLDATAVVVAEPAAYHLSPDAQRTIGVVHDLFVEGRGLALDFAVIPATFGLEDGTRLRVYRRQRPTSITTALETLRIIESRLPTRPGMQPDWVVVARAFPWWLVKNPDGSASWVAHPTRRRDTGRATTLAYLGGEEGLEVSGRIRFVDGRCQGATLSFSRLDRARDRPTPVAEITRRPRDSDAFELLIPRGSGRLLLSLLDYADGVSIDYCLMQIDPLLTRGTR